MLKEIDEEYRTTPINFGKIKDMKKDKVNHKTQ